MALAALHPCLLPSSCPCAAPLPCQVVLALCHEGEHPIHTKDREAMVEAYEAQARRLGLQGQGAGRCVRPYLPCPARHI